MSSSFLLPCRLEKRMEFVRIFRGSNPILRRRCSPIKDYSEPQLTLCVEDMLSVLAGRSDVIGIAAPQLGHSLRIIAVKDSENRTATVVCNPVWRPLSGKMRIFSEGCLSSPNKRLAVPRYERVLVKGWDIEGLPLSVKFKGILAATVQHEMDHLNGISWPPRRPLSSVNVDYKKAILYRRQRK